MSTEIITNQQLRSFSNHLFDLLKEAMIPPNDQGRLIDSSTQIRDFTTATDAQKFRYAKVVIDGISGRAISRWTQSELRSEITRICALPSANDSIQANQYDLIANFILSEFAKFKTNAKSNEVSP